VRDHVLAHHAEASDAGVGGGSRAAAQ